MKLFFCMVIALFTTISSFFIPLKDISFDSSKLRDNGNIISASDYSDCLSTEIDVEHFDYSMEDTSAERTREKSEDSRILVNNDNPLFLWHVCEIWNMTYTQSLVETYNALPENIRVFSAMYIDNYHLYETPDAFLNACDEILKETDKLNIPIFVQTEIYNSATTKERYTQTQLENLLKDHPSLMGYAHCELSCSEEYDEFYSRITTCINACKKYNAVYVWQEMEYSGRENFINRLLEYDDLHELMKSYSKNIIIQDKHNGRGRHFSVQANVLGAWLDGACGNWGSNVEGWLWWEEGLADYDDMSGGHRETSDTYTLKYPAALGGIDTISDLVGGANMYSSEWLKIIENIDCKPTLTQAFKTSIYPICKMIIDGAVPTKEEVISKIKVAYQLDSPDDYATQGTDASLLIDLYAGSREWYKTYEDKGVTKKWVPTTGRYYIIPILPHSCNAKNILPNAKIIDGEEYYSLCGFTANSKLKFFNSYYQDFYSGTATLFDVNDITYIFNNHEAQTIDSTQNAQYTFSEYEKEFAVSMEEHTYMIAEDNTNGVNITLCNTRADVDAVCKGEETYDEYVKKYVSGENLNNKKDLRTTVISIYDVDKLPTVKVNGTDNASVKVDFSKSGRTCTITVVSNGLVNIRVSDLF